MRISIFTSTQELDLVVGAALIRDDVLVVANAAIRRTNAQVVRQIELNLAHIVFVPPSRNVDLLALPPRVLILDTGLHLELAATIGVLAVAAVEGDAAVVFAVL